jgi:hypothetical protein
MHKINRVGEAKVAADADQGKENTSRAQRDALFEWEDDGGARRSDAGGQTGMARALGERRRSEQQGLDATHDCDLRGEHRYDDAHQTDAERHARQERDDLKQRLAGRVTRRAT